MIVNIQKQDHSFRLLIGLVDDPLGLFEPLQRYFGHISVSLTLIWAHKLPKLTIKI